MFKRWIKPIASTVVTVLPPPANVIGGTIVNAADKGIDLISNLTAMSN